MVEIGRVSARRGGSPRGVVRQVFCHVSRPYCSAHVKSIFKSIFRPTTKSTPYSTGDKAHPRPGLPTAAVPPRPCPNSKLDIKLIVSEVDVEVKRRSDFTYTAECTVHHCTTKETEETSQSETIRKTSGLNSRIAGYVTNSVQAMEYTYSMGEVSALPKLLFVLKHSTQQ